MCRRLSDHVDSTPGLNKLCIKSPRKRGIVQVYSLKFKKKKRHENGMLLFGEGYFVLSEHKSVGKLEGLFRIQKNIRLPTEQKYSKE